MLAERIEFSPQYAHPDVIIKYSNIHPMLLEWFPNYFRHAVEAGQRFVAGETIQIGWMLLQFRSDPDGNLILWEPDFQSFPIEWIVGVNTTVRHLSLQNAVCEALEAEPMYPCILDPAVVSSRFGNDGEPFLMERDALGGYDSEWLFRSRIDVPEGSLLESLYAIALRNYDIVPFLALPHGSKVSFSEGVIDVELGPLKISSRTNELLAQVLGFRRGGTQG